MVLGEIWSKMAEAGGKLRVRSALNPMLWLNGLITVPAIGAAIGGITLQTWVVVIVCCVVGITLVGFCFLLIWDRDQ